MGRLQPEFLERVDSFCDRMLDVVDALHEQRRSFRILDQISACGTSVGANIYEADEGLSRADFRKSLGIAIKELNEGQFWIRLIVRRGWLAEERLSDLLAESRELKRILGSIVTRSKSSPFEVRSR